MKRLRDQRGSADPVLAEAARLLSARAPLADDTQRRQRVRARLRRRRTAPRGAMWLRAAAMLLLVCSVAAASAMIGRVAQTIRAHYEEARAAKDQQRAQSHRHHAPASLAAPAPVVAPSPPVAPAPIVALSPVAVPSPAAVRSPVAVPSPVAAPSSVAVRSPVAVRAPVAAASPIAVPRAVAAPAPAPPHRAPPAVAPAPPVAHDRESDEQRLVADAVRALRHEHDPARAALLLERYLDRYPDGVAVEDALALALEATIGRDAPRAAGFATRYLAHYPSGRWSSLAHRALEP